MEKEEEGKKKAKKFSEKFVTHAFGARQGPILSLKIGLVKLLGEDDEGEELEAAAKVAHKEGDFTIIFE